MSTKYKFAETDYLYFVTYSIIDWIDLFTRAVYKDFVVQSLEYCCEQKGLKIFAWCIMSNHVHLIMNVDKMNRPEAVLRDHKRHTSELIHKYLKTNKAESRRE